MHERKGVILLFREVQEVFPLVARNEPDLRKMLFFASGVRFRTPDGDAIELSVLPATQEVALEIIPANSSSEPTKEQAIALLRKAVADGVFDELILVMTALKWLKPFILLTADHAAQRAVKSLELRLEQSGVLCGGECVCK